MSKVITYTKSGGEIFRIAPSDPQPHYGNFFPLGYQREKKSSSRGLKKGRFFFPFGAPKEVFFSLWYPKGKKIAQGVEDRGKFLKFFWQFFSTCEKITQILEFSQYQGVKI